MLCTRQTRQRTTFPPPTFKKRTAWPLFTSVSGCQGVVTKLEWRRFCRTGQAPGKPAFTISCWRERSSHSFLVFAGNGRWPPLSSVEKSTCATLAGGQPHELLSCGCVITVALDEEDEDEEDETVASKSPETFPW